MARYPTFQDYEKKGNFQDGVKRCNDLLKKSPKDFQLLTTKLRLLYATGSDESQRVLDEIVALSTRELQDIAALEETVVASQSNVFPRPTTAGPLVAKTWDDAVKAATSTNQKLEIASVRFERAVLDHRIADAQQALIQLKAIQPKNRVVYMAHAAFTHLISTANDDLQARLAIGLARKAVSERFDDDRSLDCRVPGQIFAAQHAEKDLESIRGRPFEDSKHVADARRKRRDSGLTNGTAGSPVVQDPAAVPTKGWLGAEISALKSTFTSLVESEASTEALRAFARNAIQLFHISTSTLNSGAGRSPADACFLAISGLVRLLEQTSDSQFLFQAAFLAESLLRHDEHIHEARLILVYLYMRLSLGSLAMHLFESLSVKEIQHDTVGHVLFTRLSLIHPHATFGGHGDELVPLKRMSHALKVYVRCEGKLAETEASVLSHRQTGMVFDLQELRDSLRTSLARRINVLEQRRVARLTKGTTGDDENAKAMGPLMCESWTHTKDDRDFDAAFDYGYNIERILHGRYGTVPDKIWVLYSLAADTAWSIATEGGAMVKNGEEVLTQVERLKAGVDSQTPTERQASVLGVTASEYLAGDVACCALDILLYVQSPGQEINEQMIVTQLKCANIVIQRLNIDSLVSMSDPLSERLLDYYAYADVLRIIVVACRHARPRAGVGVAREIQELQDLAKRLFASLQRHATEQQARIKANDVRQMISKDELLWTTLQMFGGERVDGFCEEVAASAREGWEGLLKIKLL